MKVISFARGRSSAQLFVMTPQLISRGKDTDRVVLVGPVSGPDGALGESRPKVTLIN